MPVKDVTPDISNTIAANAALAHDINERWPVWTGIVKAHLGEVSSPYMMVAIMLLGQGLMAMLCAEVSRVDILKTVENLFDTYTDPAVQEKIVGLRDEKAEIMAFVEHLLTQNAEGLAKQKQMN